MKKNASPNCSFCKIEQESIEHLFYECAIVKIVLAKSIYQREPNHELWYTGV